MTVFERASYIGGRSITVNAYNDPSKPVELGASIFVEVNKILKDAAVEFGLQVKDRSDGEEPELLGIWERSLSLPGYLRSEHNG
jgi:prenylcysteine oxidase/farnesylcysteine lyase